MLRPCPTPRPKNCRAHDYQDEKYSKKVGQRVRVWTTGKDDVTCTVCAHEEKR